MKRKILAFLMAAAIVAFVAPCVMAGSVILGWDALTCPDCGVKIYIGTEAGAYQWEHDAGAGVVQTQVDNLNSGQTYYFAARAYDQDGNYSGYSNEVSYAVPGVPVLPSLPPIEVNGVTVTISIQGQ